jgi:peptidoglycan LD-endopeptidase CwlK
MASRSLDELRPNVASVAREWLKRCTQDGVQVLVYCTYRTIEEQIELFQQGRTKPGRIVTWAHGGRSWHNWRRAWDAVPMINGKPDWSCDLLHENHWQTMIRHAELLGVEWGGRWTQRKVDEDHFQIRDGLTLDQASRES